MSNLEPDPVDAAVVDGVLAAEGAQLAYRRYAQGRGDPIVLLHGARMDGRVWARVIALLAASHDVIVPDLRARGRSKCDAAVPASFVGDTLLLAGSLELRQVHLVGHSMGAGVALELAWRLAVEPAGVELVTLTLVAPTPTAGWEPGPDVVSFSEKLAAQAAAGRGEAAFETVLTHLWLADGRPRAALDPEAVDAAREVFLDNLNPSWPVPLEEDHPTAMADYARIVTPALIAIGNSDHPDVRAVAETLASTLPDASLVRLPDCGHDLGNECPNELATLVLDHIATHRE